MTDSTNPAPAILYVDDEATALKYFQRALGALAPVITAESVEEGKRLLDQHADTLAVLVSDQRMPGANGNELLFYAWDRYPHIVRILTTAYSELEHTVDAVNQGQIHRYIQKPWDIAALRMELKQALDLARLRKDHTHLLREKMLIRQKQNTANRISLLHAVCAGLSGAEPLVAVETCLAAALSVGLSAPEPDWLLADFSELLALESFRSSTLAAAVREQLALLEQRRAGLEPQPVLALLADQFGADFQQTGPDSGLFLQPRVLLEFLEAAPQSALSANHVYWMACLLWLSRRGHAMQISGDASGLTCKLVVAEAGYTPAQLAAWIDQF
ncbi:MAG: response regulator [Sphingomonadaceae bacterium]